MSVARYCGLVWLCILLGAPGRVGGQTELPIRDVAGQPLAANVERLMTALDYLGAPFDSDLQTALRDAIRGRDSRRIQQLLDPHVLALVSLNPEVRVKVTRGPGPATIQQGGYTPHLIKVINDSTVTRELRILSPQSGPVYAGANEAILRRQAQTELMDNENIARATDRFLDLEMFQAQPMTRQLSGLVVEYALALIHSSEPGQVEATIGFDVGSGTQDIGFRGEVPILFSVETSCRVQIQVRDVDGQPTVARLEIRDARGKVYPPQAKRLAPDFFFQPQIYRRDGDVILLPPGEFNVQISRGPEYVNETHQRRVVDDEHQTIWDFQLVRWINPQEHGFYCGDHHIHGAGCSHYDNPTQGVSPSDMFLQVKGEGLNVGCVLTWGPCFDFQREYFSPIADTISQPFTVLKYDLEISGFGSAALGHVCLLNLKDQTYPGSEGTKDKGWPTWTVPVMRWAKEQGGVTGYPHSAMHVNPEASSRRFLQRYDQNNDERLTNAELSEALLPAPFGSIDEDHDGLLTARELKAAIDQAADMLPNLAVPEMNGAGAMEIFVSTAEGVCDFISAMDTARIPEWNTWYHLLNCGFPTKLSGETDFPCMSSRRVGQGRVYVRLGDVERVDFTEWCEGLRKGESYVSDGFAHALEFQVEGVRPGLQPVQLQQPGKVEVVAAVAFASEQPMAVAHGGLVPTAGQRMIGDTVNLHAPRTRDSQVGGERLIELVCNGQVIASERVPADGEVHRLNWNVEVDQSSWIALRHFPQLHTNPVNVIVDNQPIRASRESAIWCAESIRLLWQNRQGFISPMERAAARKTYDRAIDQYLVIAQQAENRASETLGPEATRGGTSADNARRPKTDSELRMWLENMIWYHRLTPDEITAAIGLSATETEAALERLGIRYEDRPQRQPNDQLLVLPYPGGRHPRIGFLDGAVRPQRETKLSVFTPWDPESYVVLDIPEAIWSNLGLTYLAHTHIPTIWDERHVELQPLEWQRRADGSWWMERSLPNGIRFGTQVTSHPDHVAMLQWLHNGTNQTLSDLRVQNCVLLKGAKGFTEQSNDNKRFAAPYVSCHSSSMDRWIIVAWDPVDRAWANPPCPCLHSDPKFPDCAPGETRQLRGWFSFYQGKDIDAELARIDETGWRKSPVFPSTGSR